MPPKAIASESMSRIATRDALAYIDGAIHVQCQAGTGRATQRGAAAYDHDRGARGDVLTTALHLVGCELMNVPAKMMK